MVKDLNRFDMAFVPSLKCNLRCSFCMYNASPDNSAVLDYEAVQAWLQKITWPLIGSWGFYGGEPSADLPLYGKFMDLIPTDIPKYLITNGSWSMNPYAMNEWHKFLNGRLDKGDRFSIVISGTPEHKLFQNENIIESWGKYEGVKAKGDDDIHPMGRAYRADWACTCKCIWHGEPIRLAVFVTGDIILQNCDGAYPVIGDIYRTKFEDIVSRARQIRTESCKHMTDTTLVDINDVLKLIDERKSNHG